MTRTSLGAGLALAFTAVLASGPASAAVIRGYVDLYVVNARGSIFQYGDDTQTIEWGRCAGLCAKTRFEFEHDTDKPPHDTRVGLRLLQVYQEGLLPSGTYGDKRYLPLPIHSREDPSSSYPLMGPDYEFGEFAGPPEAWRTLDYSPGRVDLGQPGEAFRFEYTGQRTAVWGERPCAPGDDLHGECWNLDRETPAQTDHGPFYELYSFNQVNEWLSISALGGEIAFESRIEEINRFQPHSKVFYQSQIYYRFDNRPQYWRDGPPKACVWITSGTGDEDADPCGQAVPEPATVGLLALGLAGLGAVAGRGRC